jgi:hypothetical protein
MTVSESAQRKLGLEQHAAANSPSETKKETGVENRVIQIEL